MTNPTLRQALACAARGWPVFPCQPGQKTPATSHGFQDATTDPQQITDWFGPDRGWNLAIATGTPGPDVLDVDQHGPAGNGYPALTRLHAAGLLDGATAYVRTPSGGLHAYFTGSHQRNGTCPGTTSTSGPPAATSSPRPHKSAAGPYHTISTPGGHAGLDWQTVIATLDPDRQHHRPAPQPTLPEDRISRLARWVATQPEGNRNEGLFWAANRALEADQAADLSPLAAAARQAGLTEPEIARTLNSARRTTQATPDPTAQPEGAS